MFRNKRLASVHAFQTTLFCVFVDREFHVFGLIFFFVCDNNCFNY